MKIKDIFKGMSLLSILLLASCDDFLDEMPDNRTEVDTPEKVIKMLVSAYSVSLPITMNEMMSDNVSDAGANIDAHYDIVAESYYFTNVTSQSTDSPSAVWDSNYSAIASANMALQAIDRLGNSYDLSAQRGEALLCRAYAHFTLCNTFCQAYNPQTSEMDFGVPYMEGVEVKAVNTYKRGTVAQVYAKINADIETGLQLIDDNSYSQPKYHFNKRAAYAFAAQFNLYYGQYQKSIDYADIAIGEDPSPLYRSYSTWSAFTSAKEYTAAWVNSNEAANLLLQPIYSLAGDYYYYRFVLINSLVKETLTSSGPWSGDLVFKKYSLKFMSRSNIFPKQISYFEYTDQVAGIGYFHVVPVVFSVEKTIIDRAEAYAMLGDYTAATRNLSYFYVGSGASASVTASSISKFYATYAYNKTIRPKHTVNSGIQTDFIQACLHARRILTVHEGSRLYDIKRFGMSYEHVITNGTNIQIGAYDKRLVIQLPEPVIAAGMEPNPR